MKSLLVVLFFLGLIDANAANFSFRVQCSSKESPDLLAVFNKIPERQVYTMPTGSALYFSGGYFDDYQSAKRRLDEVKSLGIKDAFIRVFKNRTYLSDEVSNNLLAKLAVERTSLTYSNANDSSKSDTYKLKQDKKHVDRQALLLEKAKRNRISKAKVKKVETVANSKVKEDGSLPADFMVHVNEAPLYKILIATGKVGVQLKDSFLDLNEVVYENKLGNKVYYTIGYFKTEKEALAALKNYKNNTEYKIVGLYKNYVVSRVMANDLLSIYEASKNK